MVGRDGTALGPEPRGNTRRSYHVIDHVSPVAEAVGVQTAHGDQWQARRVGRDDQWTLEVQHALVGRVSRRHARTVADAPDCHVRETLARIHQRPRGCQGGDQASGTDL